MPNQDQSVSLILVPLVLGTAERDSSSRSQNAIMSDENPPLRIPEEIDVIHEIAEEGEEDGVTEEQRKALAETQARLIGDID
jgi:hypothetical protein